MTKPINPYKPIVDMKFIIEQAENKKELEYLMRFESWASRLAEYSQDMEEPQ